jgi:hypothetical protein
MRCWHRRVTSKSMTCGEIADSSGLSSSSGPGKSSSLLSRRQLIASQARFGSCVSFPPPRPLFVALLAVFFAVQRHHSGYWIELVEGFNRFCLCKGCCFGNALGNGFPRHLRDARSLSKRRKFATRFVDRQRKTTVVFCVLLRHCAKRSSRLGFSLRKKSYKGTTAPPAARTTNSISSAL